jgi:lambda family phage tail tape measure protein
MTARDRVQDFERQIADLDTTLANTTNMAANFQQELEGMQSTFTFTEDQIQSMSSAFSGQLRDAFEGVVFEGDRLSDALKDMARNMMDTVYQTAMDPLQDQIGGFLSQGLNAMFGGAKEFANGGAFSQGRVTPFARGGVVQSPTPFPMRGGMGLMGEAGPEAILPLTRGADGRLGVSAGDGGGAQSVQVHMNITTPDVQGFQRSQSQIAAQMSRMLAKGQRNR